MTKNLEFDLWDRRGTRLRLFSGFVVTCREDGAIPLNSIVIGDRVDGGEERLGKVLVDAEWLVAQVNSFLDRIEAWERKEAFEKKA